MSHEKTPSSELLERRRRLRRELIAIEEELLSRKRDGGTGVEADKTDNLTNGEIARYSRQLLLPEFGVRAQRRLKSSSALIVGAGGLGCPCAQYLVAAGVGRVGIVDYDRVDKSNLHRQVHTTRLLGIVRLQLAWLYLRPCLTAMSSY